MPDFVTLLIVSLAVYRLARDIAVERGPADVYRKFRLWVGRAFKPNRMTGQQHWVDAGINCPMCISFWLGLIVAIPLANSPAEWIVLALAISGLAGLMYRISG